MLINFQELSFRHYKILQNTNLCPHCSPKTLTPFSNPKQFWAHYGHTKALAPRTHHNTPTDVLDAESDIKS
eukprot:Pgem_evm1s1253